MTACFHQSCVWFSSADVFNLMAWKQNSRTDRKAQKQNIYLLIEKMKQNPIWRRLISKEREPCHYSRVLFNTPNKRENSPTRGLNTEKETPRHSRNRCVTIILKSYVHLSKLHNVPVIFHPKGLFYCLGKFFSNYWHLHEKTSNGMISFHSLQVEKKSI